jgi:hypothetical protein
VDGQALSKLINDALAATATAFFSMFGGAWVLSKAEMPIEAKTWTALSVGLIGGVALSRWNKPVGLGFAAGLGGLGLIALIAQAAGAANAGTLFGFQQAAETRAARQNLPPLSPLEGTPREGNGPPTRRSMRVIEVSGRR